MTLNDDDRRLLLDEWAGLCAARNVLSGEIAGRLPAALEAYAGPGRHYHNVRHVAECLRELEKVRGLCDDADAVAAALLFHDCVYEPRRSDNEARSADAAAEALGGLGCPRSFINTVRDLILATMHSAVPATNDGRIVADIDLSILGQPPAVFDAYDSAIRKEYAHVSDGDFAYGRAKFLRHFLARPTLFATDAFRARYEGPARENLGRAAKRWEALQDARPRK